MKRRFLSTLMALCLALSLLPTAAFAAGGDETPVEVMPVEVQPMEEPLVEETAGPTASGTNFFANGTSITITDSAPEGATEASFDDSFTAAGTDAYISWNDGETTQYIGVSSKVSVYGGKDGSASAVTVPSTSITMTGGKVANVYGGNRGSQDKSAKNNSKVSGNVTMNFSDDAKVWNLLHGGGAFNTCVEGTVFMNFENATEMNDPDGGVWPYINGGVYGNGSEGTRNIEEGTMDTYAFVNQVEITATSSNLYLVGAGGSGSTKVGTATVNLSKCTVDLLFLGGINGEVEDSSITATGCEIESFSATNRGFVGEGYVDLDDCTVDKLNTGAANGCFSSDSGGTDGSGVTRSCVWDLDEITTVKDAQLTPLVIKNSVSYTNTYENLTIQKAGDPLKLEITSFVANENNASTTQNAFTVPEGSTLTFNGVTASVKVGSTFTNAGTIDMDISSSLNADEGSTFAQIGTVTGAGKDNISGAGVKKDYVARVGSTGYDTLQDAINNASSGATVTLLADVTESVTIPKGKEIVLDLNGKKLVNSNELQNNTVAEDNRKHTITNNGTLTIIDSVGNGQVDNVSHGRTALYNEVGATATLDGGTYTRSAETGSGADTSGGNSYYTILNHGTMTINDGVTVNQGADGNGKYSSLVENGWQNGEQNETGVASVMTINGGTFSGGLNTIKNDDYGELIINGGELSSYAQACVLNWNTAKITGGTFDGTGSSNGVVLNGYLNDTMDKGELTITGGEFRGKSIVEKMSGSDNSGKIQITDGIFEVDTIATSLDNRTLEISGGNFSKSVPTEYLASSLNAELKRAAGTTPYSYYKSIAAATAAAQPGDTVTELGTATEETCTVTLKYNDGRADGTVKAAADTEITLPTPTRDGYTFRGWSDGSSTYNGGGTYKVSGNVTLTAQWSAKSQGGSSSSGGSTTYSPTLDVSDGGTIKVSPRTPEAGDKVTITPDPDSGYEVDQVTVTDRDGDEIRVTANRDGTYTFTQPRGRVTIEVTFVRETGETTFSDVSETYWAYDEIEWAYDNGYVNGTSASTFAPGASISRQQIWMILARLSGGSPADMAAAREWAMANDISDGTNPGAAVTRQQLAALLFRFAQANGYDSGDRAALTGFPDAGSVASYAVEALQWATASGVINGTSQGALNPAGTATRAQFAVMLYRFWNGL